MSALRKLTPTNHPYLFGGGISGALIAGTLVCFALMTSLVSQTPLPGATSPILPSRPGILTLNDGAGSVATPGGGSDAPRPALAGSALPSSSIRAPAIVVAGASAGRAASAGAASLWPIEWLSIAGLAPTR